MRTGYGAVHPMDPMVVQEDERRACVEDGGVIWDLGFLVAKAEPAGSEFPVAVVGDDACVEEVGGFGGDDRAV